MTPRRRDSSVFLEAFALTQAIGQLLDTAMADGPLTPVEYAFYSAIFEAELITPTDVGLRLGAPKTTVMERVRAMEVRGHVRRVEHPRDGRSYRLALTASGLAAHRQANRGFDRAYQRFLAAFGGDEGRAMTRLEHLRAAATQATGMREAGLVGRPRR